MRDPPRVALVHDWLDTWGGAENVLGELLHLYPRADLYTLVDFMPPGPRRLLGAPRANLMAAASPARAHLVPLRPAADARRGGAV